MQDVNEFMHHYFSEQIKLHLAMVAENEPFREQFYTREYSENMRRVQADVESFRTKHPPKVVTVEQTESSAIVTTSEPLLDRHAPFRYHLQRSDETWRIQQREWQCFVCNGTGTKKSGEPCNRCNGTGWKAFDA